MPLYAPIRAGGSGAESSTAGGVSGPAIRAGKLPAYQIKPKQTTKNQNKRLTFFNVPNDTRIKKPLYICGVNDWAKFPEP